MKHEIYQTGECLPFEIIQMILCYVPGVYFHFSLNIINQDWNEMIKQNFTRKKEQIDDNILMDPFLLQLKSERTENQYEFIIMDILVMDRRDIDVMPKRYNNGPKFCDGLRNFVKTYLVIKYGLKDIVMKQKFECNEIYIYMNMDVLGNKIVVLLRQGNENLEALKCLHGSKS